MAWNRMERLMSDLQIVWCDGQAAPIVHELTQAAFAPQVSLDPPSGATREDLEVVRADLQKAPGSSPTSAADLSELPG